MCVGIGSAIADLIVTAHVITAATHVVVTTNPQSFRRVLNPDTGAFVA